MINKIFKSKYPFLSNYFENYFKSKKRFPQSIVLEGLDTVSQYFFALELSRITNCLENGDENCTCLNCKWIKEGKHPSIVNVTPIDFKEDNTKTVISVKQIEKITSSINETSDYHRFFIFCNAKIMPYDEITNKKFEEYKNEGFTLDVEDWQPLPLNRKILQEEASNALLKSVEEAPDKVSFIFLTDTKENIIQTITSRSLVFKTPSVPIKNEVDFSEFFENYPNGLIDDLIEFPSKFIEATENLNIDLIQALDYIQEYLLKVLKENSGIKELILEDIKKIQHTKREITALVTPKYALEKLFISLSKEGRLC